MLRLLRLALTLLAVGSTLLALGCRTTKGSDYNYYGSRDQGVIDSGSYRDPGPEQRAKNAYSTFQM